jgi:peptidyl-prolyl cis-trans isomerase D
MPSSKNQATVQDFKKDQNNGHKKKRFIWILSVIFLILVVAVFVLSPLAGVFAPSQGSLVFGSYDGVPIEYAYGNYFYEQQQSVASSWQEDTTDENYQWQVYQIWKTAFDNTVLHTAITKQARDSGIFVTDNAVDTYLLTQGPYIGEDGTFSAELYNSTSGAEQASVRESVRASMEYQTVVNDLFSTLSSPVEIDYINSMAQDEKSFEYVVFPLNDYPEERVLAYAQANLMLFTEIDISMITLEDDEAAAEALYERLTSGELLFEDAARSNSIDGFAEDGGEAGVFAFYEIAQLFSTEDEVHELFSVAEGDISRLYKTEYGYNVFRINEGSMFPDLTDEKKLSAVKSYIIQNDTAAVETYMYQRAEEFAVAADRNGFTDEAAARDLTVHEVAATPLNYDSSTFMQSFAETDPSRHLASVNADKAALKTLYTTPAQSTSAPITTQDGVLLAYCTEDVTAEDEGFSLSMFYSYIVQQVNQEQYTKTIFSSDKFEDDFLNVFFSEILQNG